jgi:hypothetical protein
MIDELKGHYSDDGSFSNFREIPDKDFGSITS